jgi:hypothetical protein
MLIAISATCLFALSADVATAQRVLPTNLRVASRVEALHVAWGVSNRSEVGGFRLRWRAVTTPASAWGRVVELSSKAHGYKIARLSPGAYEVSVKAMLKGGEAGGMVTGEGTALPKGGEEGGEEGEEESPGEEGEGESGRTIPTKPTGPATPAGGWSVVYGDAFQRPFGTAAGDDSTFWPCPSGTGSGYATCGNDGNGNEPNTYATSQVTETAEGLDMRCTYESPGKYLCGGGHTPEGSFEWDAGLGNTLVFQTVTKFPISTGEADVQWWADGSPFTDTEMDFYEAINSESGWCSHLAAIFTAWFAAPHVGSETYEWGCQFKPEQQFNTYTTEIFPNDTYSFWIDGNLISHGIGPVTPDTTAKTGLTIAYGLRNLNNGHYNFTSGSRNYYAKYISVYEDTAHKGVGIRHQGLAPGTQVGGNEPQDGPLVTNESAGSQNEPFASSSGELAELEPQGELEPGEGEPEQSSPEAEPQSTLSTALTATLPSTTTETTPSAPTTTPSEASSTSAIK